MAESQNIKLTDTPAGGGWLIGSLSMAVVLALLAIGHVLLGRSVLPGLHHEITSAELGEATAELSKTRATLAADRQEQQQLQGALQALDEQLERGRAEVEETQVQMANAKAASERSEALNQRVIKLEVQEAVLEKQWQETQRQALKSQAELTEIESKLNDFREWAGNREELQTEVAALKTEVRELEAQADVAVEKKAELSVVLKEVENARLIGAMYAAREKLIEDSIDKLKEKRAGLSGKVSGEHKHMLREKERAVEERVRIAAELDAQRERLDDVIAEIAMKRVRIRDLTQRLEEADDLEERIKVLGAHKKSVSAELISEEIRLARFKENYRRTLGTYERNLKAQNKEHLAKSRKLAKIDEQINQAQEKRARLLAENAELEKKKGDLNP
jgi:chromosome segregation ATPase